MMPEYATAICPGAMKAAMRVNNPTKISRPAVSSITPEYHSGQSPTLTVPTTFMGHLNSVDMPWQTYKNPNTARKTLITRGVYELSRASAPRDVMSRPYSAVAVRYPTQP